MRDAEKRLCVQAECRARCVHMDMSPPHLKASHGSDKSEMNFDIALWGYLAWIYKYISILSLWGCICQGRRINCNRLLAWFVSFSILEHATGPSTLAQGLHKHHRHFRREHSEACVSSQPNWATSVLLPPSLHDALLWLLTFSQPLRLIPSFWVFHWHSQHQV